MTMVKYLGGFGTMFLVRWYCRSALEVTSLLVNILPEWCWVRVMNNFSIIDNRLGNNNHGGSK